MSLSLIIGPMFSGKSTELIRRIRIAKLLDQRVLIISNSLDKRYDVDHVVSHDREKEKCISTETLLPILHSVRFIEASHIFVEEGQFFDDIVMFVRNAVDIHKKNVTVAALDGTFLREPFLNISHLIPLAEDVVRLSALCMLCKDGTKAPFSFCLNQARIQHGLNILIGGAETYQSVCRKHYLDLSLMER